MAKQLSLPLPDGSTVPQLAFGLYKIPADEDGVSIVLEAIKVGTMWNQDGLILFAPTCDLSRLLVSIISL